MRALLLADMTGAGGIQEFNRAFLQALRRSGLNPQVLDRGHFSKIGFAVRVLAAVLWHRPDMIFCGHINFSPLAYAASFLGMPCLIFLYGIEAWDINKGLHLKALRRARLLVSVSDYTRDRVIQQTGLPPNRFFYLPPSVDGKRFAPVPPPAELAARWGLKGKKVILTIARLSKDEKYKGYDTVIKAMPEILRQMPEARYLLVGDGDDTPRIQGLVAELGLQDKVIMPGRVNDEDLRDSYNLCDVFVMPSSGEGFGIVFLEALACGKPVIAGDAGGAREAVMDGELGIMVDPADTGDITEAVLRCVKGGLPEGMKDPEVIRQKVLAAYGTDVFEGRVRHLVSIIKDEAHELSR